MLDGVRILVEVILTENFVIELVCVCVYSILEVKRHEDIVHFCLPGRDVVGSILDIGEASSHATGFLVSVHLRRVMNEVWVHRSDPQVSWKLVKSGSRSGSSAFDR